MWPPCCAAPGWAGHGGGRQQLALGGQRRAGYGLRQPGEGWRDRAAGDSVSVRPGVSAGPDHASPCSPRKADPGAFVELPWGRARGVDKAPLRHVPDCPWGSPRSRAQGPHGAGLEGSWGRWGRERTRVAVSVETGRDGADLRVRGALSGLNSPLCSPGSEGLGNGGLEGWARAGCEPSPPAHPDPHPAVAPQVFVLLFIFVKRQIMRFAMKSRRGPHVPVGQHAPKVGILHSLQQRAHLCLKGQAGAAPASGLLPQNSDRQWGGCGLSRARFYPLIPQTKRTVCKWFFFLLYRI